MLVTSSHLYHNKLLITKVEWSAQRNIISAVQLPNYSTKLDIK